MEEITITSQWDACASLCHEMWVGLSDYSHATALELAKRDEGFQASVRHGAWYGNAAWAVVFVACVKLSYAFGLDLDTMTVGNLYCSG